MGKSKPFSRHLHSIYDKPAKDKMVEVLKSWGYDGIENSDIYGVDILGWRVSDNPLVNLGNKFGIEVEVKTSWEDYDYPHEDIHIPFRKRKLLSGNVYFVVFNKSFTRLAMTHSDYVALSRQKSHVKNRFMSDETFFGVPLNYFDYYDI